jgi:hypothetical protein
MLQPASRHYAPERNFMTRHGPPRTAVAFLNLLAAALLLPGCQNPGTPSMSTSNYDTMIKEVPNPKQAYRIEMRIENAPGPFALVEGVAQYDVQNYEECGEINRVSGTISRITVSPEIVWTPKGDGVYEAVVYADRLLDEDYFGRGVCRWGMMEVRAALRATGAQIENSFVPGIIAEDVIAGRSKTYYFWRGRYPTDATPPADGKGFSSFGYEDVEKYKPELRGDLFSVTLTPKDH